MNFKIGKSTIHGRGIFADKDFKKGDELFLVLDFDEFYNRAKGISTLGRLVNHQKKCNCSLKLIKNQYYLCADKDIKKGEELTSDYSKLSFPFRNNIDGYVEL